MFRSGKMKSALLQLVIFGLLGSATIFVVGDHPMQITVSITLIYVMFASAWNIVAGYAGQFSFGHATFFGIGAYAATLLTQRSGIPPLYGLAAGAVVSAAAAAVIGAVTLRLRGLFFGLVSAVFPILFASLAFYTGLQEVSVPYVPSGGWEYLDPTNPRVLSLAALCGALFVCIITLVLTRSRFGLLLGALRSDADAAEASGVKTASVKIVALMISAALSSMAGGLYASAALVVTPGDVFGVQMSVKPVLFAVFGGLGTIAGPVLGAAILVPLSEMLNATFGSSIPGFSGLVYGAALLLVITCFPNGIIPVLSGLKGMISRRTPGARAIDLRSAGPNQRASTVIATATPEPLNSKAVERGPLVDTSTPSLEIVNASKAFGGARVLESVSFKVYCGEIVGVIGPNGAGKTTLFNVVNGFLGLDSGTVRIFGSDVTGSGVAAIARRGLGRTFQTPRLFTDLSVIDNVMVASVLREKDSRRAHEAGWTALKAVELEQKAFLSVGELSTGDLRRLELARAMAVAGDNGVLLLDEFLGGLSKTDGAVLLSALDRWRAGGGSIVAIEHTMRAMVNFVDRFVVLNFGKVIATGTPDEIWKDQEVVKAYLGDKWVA